MDLKVLDFPSQKYICKKYGGDNISPAVSWNKIPNAKSYALIIEDPDAVGNNFIHWYIPYISKHIERIDSLCFLDIANINSNIKKINLNKISIFFGKNSFDKFGYTGPCPPKGTGIHRYNIILYALDNILNIKKKYLKIKDSNQFIDILKENNISIIEKSHIIFEYSYYK